VLQSASAEPVFDHAFRRRIVWGLVFLTFIVSMNLLVVAPALATIGAQLGDVENLPWIITAYMLTSAIVPPIYGRLSDLHGRRIVIHIAIAIFLLGSICCALAPTTIMLACARGLQGVGGGAIVPLLQTAMADVMPPRERGRYQAYFSVAFGVSSVAGPLYGGLVAEHLHWSWVFWINVPLCLMALVMSHKPLGLLPRRRIEHSLDLVGAALLSGMAIMLMLGLSWGGVKFSWVSPVILGLIGAAVAFAALYAVHARRSAEPLVPIDVLRDRVVGQLAIGTVLGAVVLVGLVTYAPLYFQLVLGSAVGDAGLSATAIILGGTLGGTVYGRLMSWDDRSAHWMLLASLAVSALSAAWLAAFGETLQPLVAAVFLFTTQFGIGATFPAITIQLQNAVDRRHIGIATSTTYFVRSIGSAAGSALVGSIFLAGGHAETIANLKHGIAPVPGDPALVHTFTVIFGVLALLAAATLVSFATLERRPFKQTVD
jgi:MFS family permease